MDLLVTYRNKESVLYRDRLNGRYEATRASGCSDWSSRPDGRRYRQRRWLDIAFRSGGTAGALRNRSGVLSALHLPACAKPSFSPIP